MLGNRMEVQRLYILRQAYKRNGGHTVHAHRLRHGPCAGQERHLAGVWGAQRRRDCVLQARMGFIQFGSHDFVLGEDRQTDLLMEAAVDRLV